MASNDEMYDYDYDDEDYIDSDGEAMQDGHLEDDDDEPVQEAPVKCWAITKEALSNAQQHDLSMVMSLFNIKQHHARAVLICYRWNKESITDHMERKGQDVMLMEAGVVLQESNGVASAGSRSVTCGVCFEDFSGRDVSTMDCGHSFCNDCWTGYFVASLDSGKKQIRCMALKCPAICDEAVVQRLLRREHPAAAERFLDFLLQSYVDDNAAVKWCPSVPHCGRAICVPAGESEAPLCEVECLCGHSFCFRCAAPAHSPCPCAMWERWEAKWGQEDNVKWLFDNTRICPKCLKSIIKDGGCNHVVCKCGQYMCWLCGAATGSIHSVNTIQGHSCNRFDAEVEEKVSDAHRQLRRYEHYYKRFKAHDRSYKAERDKLGPVLAEKAIKKLESQDSVLFKDAAQSLVSAHRSLLRCRQVLSRSYVFAYYMFDEDVRTRPPETAESRTLAQAQKLFQSHQQVVEEQVEKLSKLLETTSKLQEEELLLANQNALNLAVTIEAHCAKMHACIQDELLPMLMEPMVIVPFQKKGPTKAEELPA